MLTEALLAYLHFSAILAAVVFITSEAALCRVEWLNAAVVQRLLRVHAIYCWALGLTLLSGLARVAWGIKGWAWYATQPLLLVKVGLFVVLAVMAMGPARHYRNWARSPSLPSAEAIAATRRQVMLAAHLMLLLPLAAVCLARGIGQA